MIRLMGGGRTIPLRLVVQAGNSALNM